MWIDQWNTEGYEGVRPRFGGGRPPKLAEGQKEQLRQKLKSKSNWLTHEVRALIKMEFDVAYSDRHVRKILRTFGMHYAKPYPSDYRRPDNAQEMLECTIKEVSAKIADKCVVGFLDEASPQTTDNTSICAEHKWCLKIARQFRRSNASGRLANQRLPETRANTWPIPLAFIRLTAGKSWSSWNTRLQSTCASSFAQYAIRILWWAS